MLNKFQVLHAHVPEIIHVSSILAQVRKKVEKIRTPLK